jgi:iron complex transport system ATP-binding protein
MLEVRDLHCAYDQKEVVFGVDFDVSDGELVCIIGANGCGKTTTLKNVLGLYRPQQGSVTINGADALTMDERERARHFAYIPQVHRPPFPFTVADVVILGRTPHLNSMTHASPADRAIAYKALQTLSIEHLAHEVYTQLSGGQQQLVLIARALAQEPDVLIMDEPTASLDFGNQQVVLSQMRRLVETGTGVLMVTHDPGHAFYCADRVIVMQEGRVTSTGTPAETITTATLETIYHARVEVQEVFVERISEKRNVVISL